MKGFVNEQKKITNRAKIKESKMMEINLQS